MATKKAAKNLTVYVVVRKSSDVQHYMVEIMGIFSTREKARSFQEKLFDSGLRSPTEILVYGVDP